MTEEKKNDPMFKLVQMVMFISVMNFLKEEGIIGADVSDRKDLMLKFEVWMEAEQEKARKKQEAAKIEEEAKRHAYLATMQSR